MRVKAAPALFPRLEFQHFDIQEHPRRHHSARVWVCVLRVWHDREGGGSGREGEGKKHFLKKRNQNLENSFLNEKTGFSKSGI